MHANRKPVSDRKVLDGLRPGQQLQRTGETVFRDAEVLRGPGRRIKVNDQAVIATQAQCRRKMHRIGRLSNAAFLIADADHDTEL